MLVYNCIKYKFIFLFDIGFHISSFNFNLIPEVFITKKAKKKISSSKDLLNGDNSVRNWNMKFKSIFLLDYP